MSALKRSDKIFVAGHRGLVGSAIVEALNARGYHNILKRTRDELNLLDQQTVHRFLAEEKPDVVFLAAAKVGGILANNTYRADFIYDNLQVQNNVIWGSHLANVRRLVFLGSSCIYPRNCPQPMKEEYLLTGELENTNRPYAIAKIAGLELVNTMRQQYGRDWFSVMPTNLYGPRDNFHPENSHVLPGLLRRFEEARLAGAESVTVWGTGSPRREFMYSLDCANAIVSLAEFAGIGDLFSEKFDNKISHINVGTGEDITIRELAEEIGRAVGFAGRIEFDATKPDGTPRKLQDVGLMLRCGARHQTSLQVGLAQTVDYFRTKFRETLALPSSGLMTGVSSHLGVQATRLENCT